MARRWKGVCLFAVGLAISGTTMYRDPDLSTWASWLMCLCGAFVMMGGLAMIQDYAYGRSNE